MNTLRSAAADYLRVRRALGFKLYDAGLLLGQFVDFLQARHTDTITIELAVQWAISPPGTLPAWHARRLTVVRDFARWRQASDPHTQVPPTGLLPAPTQRMTPYLYSDEQVAALIEAAGTLRSPLKAATMQTFIGLVFATGIRRGEALGLDRADLDPVAAVLTIRAAKRGKTRRLPIHPSTVAALTDYQHLRDRLWQHPHTDAFFLSTTGARLSPTTVSQTFRGLLPQAGIEPPPHARRPRIHDARHSFAVSTLLQWYRAGDDVQARLPLLSAYLGHTGPAHTYWYLSAAPELLTLAADRLETYIETEEGES
ncbi:tyrosine-type recombinase/integrase [Leekyejoonella antrihumi]|uniref:Integrase n=1 Tax=Leekyejoonella antrihumi TaxID=1660198 RepID=A0A563DPR6_9MICO|nr:tyrosine-type recombinase/integrase [Leekyejoonella antrihumi]TWP32176.1 integrase [Leekyejoonella antrihumi]